MLRMQLTYEYMCVKENIDILYIEYLLLNFSVHVPNLVRNNIINIVGEINQHNYILGE